jgi:hypothetical protein
LPKRNLLNKVVGFTGKKFTLAQFALYTYAQNVVCGFVARPFPAKTISSISVTA